MLLCDNGRVGTVKAQDIRATHPATVLLPPARDAAQNRCFVFGQFTWIHLKAHVPLCGNPRPDGEYVFATTVKCSGAKDPPSGCAGYDAGTCLAEPPSAEKKECGSCCGKTELTTAKPVTIVKSTTPSDQTSALNMSCAAPAITSGAR